jgi:hypothetical protein
MTQPKRYLFAIIDGGGTVPADTSVIGPWSSVGTTFASWRTGFSRPTSRPPGPSTCRGTGRLSGRTSIRRA